MSHIPDRDPAVPQSFDDKLLTMYNHAALVLMISIGHRTTLFDTMSTMPPSTSQEIADGADLNERYVREWLGALTVGEIVHCDARETGNLYSLPDSAALNLTRASGADNLGVFAQYIPLLGRVENDIIDCFRNGGGVPYESFDRFHEVMAEDSGQSVLSSLLSSIIPLAPGLHERLERGIDVLDAGCGAGKALILLAGEYPKSRFTGYDLCEGPIAAAREQANFHGLANVSFEQKDLTEFDVDGRFDLITAFDAIHDQARPDTVLRGIHQALRSDGVFLMQDIAGSSSVENNMEHPLGPLLYALSCMHCMTVSLAQGGMGLGAMWGRETAESMLREAGFKSVEVHALDHDPQNYYYIVGN